MKSCHFFNVKPQVLANHALRSPSIVKYIRTVIMRNSLPHFTRLTFLKNTHMSTYPLPYPCECVGACNLTDKSSSYKSNLSVRVGSN